MRQLIFILIVISFIGCKRDVVYEKQTIIENNIWYRIDRNHLLKFEAEIKDIYMDYTVYIKLRYKTSYSFNNLKIGFCMYSPENEERYSEHNLQLKNKDGSFIGSRSGDYRDFEFPLLKNIEFSESGKYKFELENLMDKYEIPGIMQIGISVKKEKKLKNN
ncbi:MAG: gliding motility lipoprotein GldH [Bacteroidales bacterium]|nr:gliding motility lipoprotein GldH [Bacteroidales bacterium]